LATEVVYLRSVVIDSFDGSGVFGLVQPLVGQLEQLALLPALGFRRAGHPERCGRLDDAVGGRDRPAGDLLSDALGDVDGLSDRGVAHEDDELLAAVAAEDVFPAQDPEHPQRDAL
jgi:hypothetical protein